MTARPALSQDSLLPSTDDDEDQPPAHYLNHRHRLRRRFIEGGAQALQEYEMVELILFSALPRRDVKPLAKDLLRVFGSLWDLVNASPDRLAAYGLKDGAIAALTIVGAAALRAGQGRIMNQPVFGNWDAVMEYCRAAMAHENSEQLRLMFIGPRNRLLAEEVQQRGTVNHTPVYTREVVRRALELGATALVMLHNHPSGDPTPSRADLEQTREIDKALKSVSIDLLDHVIIGRGGRVFSMKNESAL
ncbi:MAG: DNA repair protein RadC [Alphaproteobacteria bacterium]|nr:MAG: DNA repair protein RadC [Alphaproteobacteria bacterium]